MFVLSFMPLPYHVILLLHGYNFKFGSSFVRDYSRVEFSLVRLIKEIRDKYIYVPGFDCFSLNCMAHAASHY